MHRNIFVVGDSVELHCEDGYSVDSTSAVILFMCIANGAWFPTLTNNGEKIQCQPVHCPPPPEITNTSAILSSAASFYQKGDEVQYICPKGSWTMGNSGPSLAFESRCEVNHTAKLSDGKPTYRMVWVPNIETQLCLPVTCPSPGEKKV